MAKTSQIPVNTGTTEIIYIDHGKYLSDFISSLPFGKIDKTVPNIGATTLEIKDTTRNSIIVFPTISLAATKAKAHGIHYFGSKFQDINPSDVKAVKSEINTGQLVKIAVVADTFLSLYESLKDLLINHNFFLLFDEIDSFQTESNYRPRLEECFDIYFKFPPERRCLISATLETFSDPRLDSERSSVINVNNYLRPNLKIIYATQSVIKVASEYIEQMANTSKNEKLFIAFNSISGILKIINLLPQELRTQSGILCSKQSLKKFNSTLLSEIKDGILKHRITFFTSAFFVGIDIKEQSIPVHSIIVAEPELPTSLLSLQKIRQIIGRVRHGSKTNTLILGCDPSRSKNLSIFSNELKSRTEAYKEILDIIETSFVHAGITEEGESIKSIMLKACMIDNVPLLRKVDGKVKISFMNVDHLKLRYSGLKNLYVDIRNAEYNLKKFFTISRQTLHSSLNSIQLAILQKVDDHLADEKKIDSLNVLMKHETDSDKVSSTFDKVQTEIWNRAVPPIDRAKVENHVKKIINDGMKVKELKRVLFQVKVFSQGEGSSLLKYLNMHFTVGNTYSSLYIHEKLNEIARALNNDFIEKERTKTTSVQSFNKIYHTQRKKNPVTNKFDRLVLKSFRDNFVS